MANRVDAYWKKRFTPLKKSIGIHENRISAILSRAIAEPKRTGLFWNNIRVQMRKEYVAIGKLYSRWSKVEIPKAYRRYLRENMAKVGKLKSITNTAKLNFSRLSKNTASTQIISALVNDSISDMSGALAMGNVRMNRLTRLTQQTLVNEFLIDTAVGEAFEAGNLRIATVLSRPGSVANSLVTQAKNGRFISIINKNGVTMSYRARHYAEMVSRVKFHEAQSQSAIVTARNYDTDLVRVSSHGTTTPICLQFEGKIFSMSGKDKRFPSLAEAPPFHVNCLHFLTPTFVEALEAQGKLKEFSDFSLGKTEVHPTDPSFIPQSTREGIKIKAEGVAKKTKDFKSASPKKKRQILRDRTIEALVKAAA